MGVEVADLAPKAERVDPWKAPELIPQTVERIRGLHKLGLVVAERIARGQPVYRGLARGAVRRALEALRGAGIIASGGRGEWRFSNPLLRRFIEAIAPFE